MIQIKDGKLAVSGTNSEIIEDLRDLVMTICMRNKHKDIVEIEEVGYKSELIDHILNLESLLRMIYTCYSISEESFKELLEANRKIVDEINKGEFKLIYKEGEN